MKKIENLKIDIFADGADINSILELNKNPLIKGFTTNPTLMRKAGISNYKEFANEILNLITDKPISFEVFADDINEMKIQAYEIASWGKNINIKIPITNTKGQSTASLVSTLTKNNIICNVTAIFTIKQIQEIIDQIDETSHIILSVFAGRIADTGIDPKITFNKVKENIRNNKNYKTLWASPREIYNLYEANDIGADIITITPQILKKTNLFQKDLNEYSLETVKMFYDDAQKNNLEI